MRNAEDQDHQEIATPATGADKKPASFSPLTPDKVRWFGWGLAAGVLFAITSTLAFKQQDPIPDAAAETATDPAPSPPNIEELNRTILYTVSENESELRKILQELDRPASKEGKHSPSARPRVEKYTVHVRIQRIIDELTAEAVSLLYAQDESNPEGIVSAYRSVKLEESIKIIPHLPREQILAWKRPQGRPDRTFWERRKIIRDERRQ